ncbi:MULTISPECIES: beta-galactosidase [Pseudomonas chlororaphis group]|uniref:beta-galactosidase n=1 Tax=Pseudomonas chlororaphis group TaxID=136842 RepID=UPI002096A804|nr:MULTISPECIES: beta-galactosidase [Pseudomonas chlororaphis group]MCO7576018.1 beta-galactosidase [Pseudomonas protegens]MCO7581144.1 beta-galactosidase [Pseudomonas chlororaphis]MCO7597831.1 beta-galactosidase [Pseudomonas chlororaphis]
MIRRSLPAVFALLFTAPVWAAPTGQQTLFNFVRPAAVVQVATQDASLPQSNAEQTAEGEVLRRIIFNPTSRPSLTLTPQSGAWDWSQSGMMSLRIQSAMNWALTLYVTIQSNDGKTLVSRVDLPAGPAQTLLVPLVANTPLSQGMKAAPPMPMTVDGQRILLASSEGQLDRSQVVSVTLSLDSPKAAQSILLERFGVQDGEGVIKAVYGSLVDGYGQSTRSRWPEKITSDDQLKAADAKEQQQLKAWLGEREKTSLDKFGGWDKGPSFKASGFFRTEKRDGRWFLVTPQGHPFYSLGVNTVAPDNSQTYVAGREWMFSALPKDGEPLASHYGEGDNRGGNGADRGRGYNAGRWYDFYRANLQRTYSSPCAMASEAPAEASSTEPKPAAPEAAAAPCATPTFDERRWVSHTLDRLQAWGFNTIGNWSAPALGAADRVPYTLPLSIVGDYASISTGSDWWGGMPDPFDPRFAMATERAVAIAARDHRDDPWLIGYFADNELAWAGPGDDPQARYALAYGTLRLTTDVPAKRAFLKQLRDKYRNQAGLSKAWGIDLPAWELMEDPGFVPPQPSPEHPEIEADFKYFQKVFAETYFKTIADSLKWHAPNHLLLGGRFAVSNPEAVAACAQYCDVLSFNMYTLKPQDGQDFAYLRSLDKPVLVTEFNFGSRDRGPFWGGVTELAREEDRGPAYANFLKQAVSEPSIVGVHWFQYLDQPVTGRLLDGENGHFGLVGITDVPFQGFVDNVRKSNLQAIEQLAKETQKARVQAQQAEAAEHGSEGAGKGHEGKGAGEHAGGHSANGH